MTDDFVIEMIARAMAEDSNDGDFYDNCWCSDERRHLWCRRAVAAIRLIHELPVDVRTMRTP